MGCITVGNGKAPFVNNNGKLPFVVIKVLKIENCQIKDKYMDDTMDLINALASSSMRGPNRFGT
jgi:hypothetical protein